MLHLHGTERLGRTMYEELVKRMRQQHQDMDCGNCNTCVIPKAADAVEELQQTAKHYKECSDDWYKEACDYKAMLPRWITVSERLPEDGSDILAVQSCCGEVRIIPANYDRGVWYDCIFNRIAEHITHWMPLPEPPKEEA